MKKYKIIRNIEKKDFSKFQIILFSLMLGLFLSLTSCDDFIDVEPTDVIATGSFYSNADELAFAVNGVYALQRGIYGDNLWFIMQEIRSDNVTNISGNADAALDIFQETSTNNILSLHWTKLYILINNANMLLAKSVDVPQNNATEAVLIKRLVGEAKFIRALAYFHLTTTWGGVPLRKTPTTDFDNAIVATSSQKDVFDFIIKDLTEASEVLPDRYPGGSLNEVGRATRFAAQALLGKVQLQNGNKVAASAALTNVIGQYKLLPNFEDIFAPGNDNHSESIFEVGFDPTSQTGMTFNNFFISTGIAAHLGVAAGGFGGEPIYFPTQDVMGIYEPNDLRAAASFSEFGGVEYINKFIDLSAVGEGSDINWIILRYADVLLLKAEADGESSASYELINQVRRRGFGKDPMVANPAIDINISTSGTFFEKVQLERRRELAFEEQRWIDLQRFSKVESVKIMNNHFVNEYPVAGRPKMDTHNLLYPIPSLEIKISKGLVTQNPGYDN